MECWGLVGRESHQLPLGGQACTSNISNTGEWVSTTGCAYIPKCLLRPCWAPPVSGVVGVTTPCSTTLEVGGAVSTRIGGRFQGARFLGRAVGPIRTGDRAPESAVCGGWRRSRMEVGWLVHMQHARTGQMRMREARSRVPHVTSRQDSIVQCSGTCPPSTVHLQSTLIIL